MRIAIYEHNEDRIKTLVEYAQSSGCQPHDIFIYSEKERPDTRNSDRPFFKALRMDARQNHFHIVLVWDINSFSRESFTNTLSYLQDFAKYNVRLMSYTEEWVYDMYEAFYFTLEYAASFEKEKLSRKIKAGIQRRKNLGNYSGGRPKKTPPSNHAKKKR